MGLLITMLILSADILKVAMGREVLPRHESHDRLATHPGDMLRPAMESSTVSRRDTETSTTNSLSSLPPVTQAPVARATPKARSPAPSGVPSSLVTASPSSAEPGLIERRSTNNVLVPLRAFFLGVSALMDAESRSAFERVALDFISDRIDRADPSVEAVTGVNVTDQRLTWTRLVEGSPRTGLDVSFEVGVALSGDAQVGLEVTMQTMLEEDAEAFRASFDIALQGGGRGEPADGLASTAGFGFETVKVPLGLAATSVGCAGVIAILVSFYCVKNSENKKGPSAGSDKSSGRLGCYPIQQISQSNLNATKQQHWHDVSPTRSSIATRSPSRAHSSVQPLRSPARRRSKSRPWTTPASTSASMPRGSARTWPRSISSATTAPSPPWRGRATATGTRRRVCPSGWKRSSRSTNCVNLTTKYVEPSADREGRL